METPFHDLIEEYHSEDIIAPANRSVNHSRIIHRVSAALDRYSDQYDILPELELDLSTGKCKPDVCVYLKLPEDWDNDIIYYSQPPLIAIEVQSPKQATTDITAKMNAIYFPAGVGSVWLVVPALRLVQIRTVAGISQTYTSGVIKDPVTPVEIQFSSIFR